MDRTDHNENCLSEEAVKVGRDDHGECRNSTNYHGQELTLPSAEAERVNDDIGVGTDSTTWNGGQHLDQSESVN